MIINFNEVAISSTASANGEPGYKVIRLAESTESLPKVLTLTHAEESDTYLVGINDENIQSFTKLDKAVEYFESYLI